MRKVAHLQEPEPLRDLCARQILDLALTSGLSPSETRSLAEVIAAKIHSPATSLTIRIKAIAGSRDEKK
jgi:hypothetical protein